MRLLQSLKTMLGGTAGGHPSQAQMGGYQGASHDDNAMAGWNPQSGSADSELLPDLDTLVARSQDLSRNNGLMCGVQQTMTDNIVGHILRLSAMPDNKLLGWDREKASAWATITEAKFRSYAETTECDAGRTMNLLGLTTQALRAAFMNGDALALPMWIPREGHRWNTRLMMIESPRLATPPSMMHKGNVRGGIELDQYGAPTAYHIMKQHPGDSLAGLLGFTGTWGLLESERIQAFTDWGRRRVLHLHDKERTGQSRGKPIVSAVMREFHMAGKYSANELQASVASSLVAAFLESDLDPESAANLFGDNPREQWNQSMKQAQNIRGLKGAAVIPLPIGAKLQGFAPNRPNQAFEAFMLAVLRHIAAGLNIPYELLAKDFSQTNYSSARAALLEAWRYFNGRRRWLVDYWLKPIYELWLEEAIDAGEIEAPDYYTNRYAYTRCRFIFGGRGWVDPVKEATGAAMRIDAGLSTLQKECAEQGEDWEEVLDQQQLEAQMRRERGLTSARDAAASAAIALAEQEAKSQKEQQDEEQEAKPQEAET